MLPSFNLYFQSLRKNWLDAFQLNNFKKTVLGTAVAFLIPVSFLHAFFNYLEQRPGCNLEDSVLTFLPAIGVSHFIFIIIYISIIFQLFYIIRSPWLFFRMCHVFMLMHFIRNICLYLTPLNPPVGIIVLQDPFLQHIIYNKCQPITKDLFFSGHTSTIFIFMLFNWGSNVLRISFGLLTILMAVLLLIQHCHYTVDILGAVAFSYLSFTTVLWLWNKFELPLE